MWGSVISASASLLGSAMQGDAAGDAANAQAASAGMSTAEMRRQYNQNREDAAPWRNTGGAAISRLGVLLGLSKTATPTKGGYVRDDFIKWAQANPEGLSEDPLQRGERLWRMYNEGTGDFADYGNDEKVKRWMGKEPAEIAGLVPDAGYGDLTRKFTLADFESDPVIQKSFDFGLSEGQKAVQRMFGARGMSRSGAAVKAATRFATDYTGQQAGASRDRFIQDQDKLFNRLAGVAESGQTATQGVAAVNSQLASGIANTAEALGNARGAAAIARGNSQAGALNSVGNAAQRYFTMGNLTTPPFNPNASYNSAGVFTPYYSGVGSGGDYQYG